MPLLAFELDWVRRGDVRDCSVRRGASRCLLVAERSSCCIRSVCHRPPPLSTRLAGIRREGSTAGEALAGEIRPGGLTRFEKRNPSGRPRLRIEAGRACRTQHDRSAASFNAQMVSLTSPLPLVGMRSSTRVASRYQPPRCAILPSLSAISALNRIVVTSPNARVHRRGDIRSWRG